MGAHADLPGALNAPAHVVTAPGVLLRDWGEASAVAFVTASASTHLLSGEAAGILALCATARDVASLAAEPSVIEALLAAGLLQHAP